VPVARAQSANKAVNRLIVSSLDDRLNIQLAYGYTVPEIAKKVTGRAHVADDGGFRGWWPS